MAHENYAPVPFDHTYILYDPRDAVSVLCVQLSLLPVYVMLFYTSWFVLTREIQPVIMGGGHVIGDIANKVIKGLIRQPRPDFHKGFGGNSALSYGMPLAHSQFMGFLALYTCLYVVYKVPPTLGVVEKVAACAVLVAVAACVAFSRVYLLYHTTEQVMMGLGLGLVLGTVYFTALEVARDVGIVDWILLWPMVRFFYVKDSFYHHYKTFAEEYSEYTQLRNPKM